MPVRSGDKVLACVDQSPFAEPVADYAAWVANRLNAPLEFLHVLDRHPEVAKAVDHSGAIGFDAQENLLSELSGQDELRSREAREQGRVFLNGMRERAMAAGVQAPDVRQRHGSLDESIVEQEPGVQMFVLGRRGEAAQTTQRDLGRYVEQVARAVHRPLMIVPAQYQEPRKILIAFDGGNMTRRGVRMVAASPLFRGLPVHLIMAGEDSADARKQLAWAKALLADAGFEGDASLMPGDAETTVARAVHEQQFDLLVMGSYTRSAFRALFFGSKTSGLLRSAKVPTLLLRR